MTTRKQSLGSFGAYK